jgi:DNA-binding NarL/FixJ family response regulator
MKAVTPEPGKSETSAEIKDEIKEEPDIAILGSRSTGRRAPAPRSVKAEEPDNGHIDLTLPEADVTNMFEDVDEGEGEDEIVDLTYEGIADVNGVSHFVCEGMLIAEKKLSPTNCV